MSHEVLNEALASTAGSNGTCTVSYSGLLYHSTYMPISRAAVRKSDPDTSFLDASCLSYLIRCPCPTLSNPHECCCERYSSPIRLLSSTLFFFSPLYLSLCALARLYPLKNEGRHGFIRWNVFHFVSTEGRGERILEKFYIPRRYSLRKTEVAVVKRKERNFFKQSFVFPRIKF